MASTQHISVDENIKRLVKMAIAIALLPPERAWDGYEALRNYSLEIEDGIDAETRVRDRQFVDYIRSFWLERMGPNDSVCSWTRIEQTTLWSQAIGPLTTLLEPHILPRGSLWKNVGILASSANIERVFSTAADILSLRRSRTKPETFESLLFIKKNAKIL
ncbi:hypothetical protein DAPPUDRAFT_329287 [Daphnia pulex]|uniref:HAT C-terminal dimerisation domain-containing protein n=1 Tax=Daphnia pulex TaxID=6669 RepID=E9HG63_DAPPU|nr:hypothetical protein DAPPUDRAFT_329287 [Daphnia pulex]|eukprot:EFX69257.1 hypothetical protein DAPPUDRAFT_329287 [Daphnia pulex]